jgi:alpha-tubulin suppressor-like RCC1 family protein
MRTSTRHRRHASGLAAVAATLLVMAGLVLSPAQALTDGTIVDVALGDRHTCVITDKGRVLCWGENDSGQLGDGTRENSSTPVEVRDLPDASVALAAGGDHTCALMREGNVFCWGANGSGQLGDKTTEDSSIPVMVAKLAGVRQITAGGDHTCAIDEGGVVCWGAGRSGQIGDGAGEDRSIPTRVEHIERGVTQVAAGDQHTCAVHEDGTLDCWGANEAGQLGLGDTKDRMTPERVRDLDAARSITAGGNHTCAVVNKEVSTCWGANERGQIGDGTTTDRSVPVRVEVPALGGMAAGGRHTCATNHEGAFSCWGANGAGQLGDGTRKDRSLPMEFDPSIGSIETIDAGGDHTCALTHAGALACWGANDAGQLGDGTTTGRTRPVWIFTGSGSERLPQTIEFEPPASVPFGTMRRPVSATAGSGLPVTVATKGPCMYNGTTLRFDGVGTCVAFASQAGDKYFEPAEVTRFIEITPASVGLNLRPAQATVRASTPITLSIRVKRSSPFSYGPLDSEVQIVRALDDKVVASGSVAGTGRVARAQVQVSIDGEPGSRTDLRAIYAGNGTFAPATSKRIVLTVKAGPVLREGRKLPR